MSDGGGVILGCVSEEGGESLCWASGAFWTILGGVSEETRALLGRVSEDWRDALGCAEELCLTL